MRERADGALGAPPPDLDALGVTAAQAEPVVSFNQNTETRLAGEELPVPSILFAAVLPGLNYSTIIRAFIPIAFGFINTCYR